MISLDLNFLIPSQALPSGGVLSLYSFAESLLEFGHSVRIVHVGLGTNKPARLEEMSYMYQFDSRVHHEFIDDFRGDLSGGDFVFCFDDRIPKSAGLPLMWIQAVLATGLFGPRTEQVIFGCHYPKLCTSGWLKFVAEHWGSPEHQQVLVPYGLDLEAFHPIIPLDDRGQTISMLYHPHPLKGADVGLKALYKAKSELPELKATLFGTAPPPQLPNWISYSENPPKSEIINNIYNGHAAFVMSSYIEGFGITGIEAQACGTPLIVAANGGSGDYAIHNKTALVSAPGNDHGMANNIVRVLTRPIAAETVARGGLAVARTHIWRDSANIIDEFLARYAACPEYYQQSFEFSGKFGVGWRTMVPLLKTFHSRCGTGIPWLEQRNTSPVTS
jgi:glycosyltransferase involved in cell wall biosynthesis